MRTFSIALVVALASLAVPSFAVPALPDSTRSFAMKREVLLSKEQISRIEDIFRSHATATTAPPIFTATSSPKTFADILRHGGGIDVDKTLHTRRSQRRDHTRGNASKRTKLQRSVREQLDRLLHDHTVLRGGGIRTPLSLPFFIPPPKREDIQAVQLLRRLYLDQVKRSGLHLGVGTAILKDGIPVNSPQNTPTTTSSTASESATPLGEVRCLPWDIKTVLQAEACKARFASIFPP